MLREVRLLYIVWPEAARSLQFAMVSLLVRRSMLLLLLLHLLLLGLVTCCPGGGALHGHCKAMTLYRL